MNRELEFKVWFYPFKRFLSGEEWQLDFNGKLKFVDLFPESTDGPIHPIISENDYEVVQYTGLKDKNERKIFEGDLIEGRTYHYDKKKKDLVFSEVNKGHVWYINGSWNVSFNHLYSESSCHLAKFDLYSTEVIGNILENPELIK